jgi:tetratricopeptide (TPR) repeat protein
MVHEKAGQLEPAEQAYRQSLAIDVRENDLAGQASSLCQLGNLYDSAGRQEDAATFYRQAAEVYLRIEDLAHEGVTRSNLADTLINLHRFDEARQELQRAIECKKPYGHAAEPWKTWAILENLERTTEHPEAAQAARQQAIATYLAYRRAGGVSQSSQTQLFALVIQAVQQNAQDTAAQQLNELLEPDDPPHFAALIRQLQAILAGDRNPALVADPELAFNGAAELRLLLESLRPSNPEP